jgi:iron(III) transport system permease protein
LLDAASLDGAGMWRKVAHVHLPLHWRSVVVAWLVAFVLAAGELSATVLVAPPGVTPLAVRIFNLVHYGVDDQLAGLVLFVWTIVLVVTAAVFVLAGRIGRAKV